MTTNLYFNHITATNEQGFYEAIIIENIQVTGFDVYYIPREYLNIDSILGEVNKSELKHAYKVEMAFTSIQGYGGEGDLMSKFGFKMNDTSSFIISKKRFNDLNVTGRVRPREGDVIYFGEGYGTFSNSFFEINFVEHENPNWQLGKYFVYELRCDLLTYNYEKVATGIPAIDSLQTDNTNAHEIELGINTAIKDKKTTLVNITEKNPFGDF